MRRFALIPAVTLLASPAAAASGPFVSLRNTDFVVLLAFLVLVAILLWQRVPSKLGAMLDGRAAGIRTELAEARALREEAQTLLASFERKRGEIAAQADRIVTEAREGAERAAVAARADLERSVARRLESAEAQIAQAEAKAVREVRDQAVSVAVAAARDLLAAGTDAEAGSRLIDQSIDVVAQRLH